MACGVRLDCGVLLPCGLHEKTMNRLLGKNLARAAWIGLWLVLLLALWAWAWPQQIERGCWLAEWPFEQGCSDYSSGHLETTTPTQQVQHLSLIHI